MIDSYLAVSVLLYPQHLKVQRQPLDLKFTSQRAHSLIFPGKAPYCRTAYRAVGLY